jgi:formylglycine-generating enzyme required for sulfatase activity
LPSFPSPSNPSPSNTNVNLQTFEFSVITVNAKGEKVKEAKGKAESFKEDLGSGSLDMVAIPGGEFLMGTSASQRAAALQAYLQAGVSKENAEKWLSSEQPQHQVKLKPFLMGKCPVTQAQWKIVAALPKIKLDLQPDPSNFKGAQRPVEQISWDEAVEFCDRLSQKTGKPYHLPSEAEWEYACRAGTTTPFSFGETITTDLVNCDGNYPYGEAPKGTYRKETTDVGSFPANAFGLFDLHGNVWEWCLDRWHENYQGAPIEGSAWLTENDNRSHSEYRLLRGGSWCNNPRSCRSALRGRCRRDNQDLSIGFRVVCAVPRIL